MSTVAAATREIVLAHEADFAGWREAARDLIAAGVPPSEIVWRAGEDGADLFAADTPLSAAPAGAGFTVPGAFLRLAESAARHSDAERFALLYRLLWRIARGERSLMQRKADAELVRVERMAKAVARDEHKMTAFVRFREVARDGDPLYVAWFEPEHHIVEATAPFFAGRFANMDWAILTPRRSVSWDRHTLTFASGAQRRDAPSEDAMEADWRAYFASIFNPARLNLAAMRAEMPKKYWRNLPEASLIKPLAEAAMRRTRDMIAADPVAPPARKGRVDWTRPQEADGMDAEATDIAGLRRAAAACRACPLWEDATQTVFGEGPEDAPLVFVGEQPGDQEDLEGRPFVGPAGHLFDQALAQAGIDRGRVYVTNAVKHFKFLVRGKRRLHQKPGAKEIAACHRWLGAELSAIGPKLVVALGATAGRSVLGREVRILRERGSVVPLEGEGARAFITVHPSFLLRLPDAGEKQAELSRFVDDLRTILSLVPEVGLQERGGAARH